MWYINTERLVFTGDEKKVVITLLLRVSKLNYVEEIVCLSVYPCACPHIPTAD